MVFFFTCCRVYGSRMAIYYEESDDLEDLNLIN